MTQAPTVRPRRRSTAAWAGGAAAVGLVVVSTVVISPVLPVLIVVLMVLVAVAAARPKAFVVLGLTVMAITVLLERAAGSAAGNADEVIVLIAVVAFGTRRLVTEGRLARLPGTVPLLVFIGAGLAASVQQHVPAATVLAAALIYLKAPLFAFALAQLHWGRKDLQLLVRFGVVAIVVVSVAGLINLVAPYPWAQLTTGRAPISFIGPIPALNGLFQHPAAMSRFCALLAMGAVAYAVVVRGSGPAVAAAAITTAFSVLTFEVKSLLGLVAAYLVLGIRWMRPMGLVTVLCIAPLGLAIVGPAVVYLVGGTLETYVFQESARLRLTTGAIDLAAQHLPLGAGLGRWGSSPAASDYSPLYLAAGFENVSGLSPDEPQYLNDTQWPGILGETGWLGAAGYLGALVVAGASLVRPVASDEQPLERWIRTAGLAWMIVLVVESVAAPVFVSTPSYPFLFLGAGVVASIRLDRRDRGPAPSRLKVPHTAEDVA